MQKIPKKIGFNGRPFCQSTMRGLSRHTLELIRYIHGAHPEVEIYIYCFEEISEFYKNELPFAKFRVTKSKPKILWDLVYLARDVRRDQIDLFHSTNNLGVPLWIGRKIPVVTTIHDHFTHEARLPWGRSLKSWWSAVNYRVELLLLLRSDAYLTVSESARLDIGQRLKIDLEKITVAYNGTSLNLSSEGGPVGQYYLYVGGMEERKNILVLLEGFLQFRKSTGQNQQLFLAGDPTHGSAEVQRLVKENPHIFSITGPQSDLQLAQLYQSAQALIFPSKEEGFGLPLIEAMALGCPVIISEIPVFKEIAADAALYFKVDSPESLAAILSTFSQDPELRTQLKEIGRLRAEGFTWPKMGEKIFSTYMKVL